MNGNKFFRTITEEILDYVVREMTDPSGGFYSTQDADSEGEEGKFFVWMPDEIRSGNAMATTVLLKMAAFTNDSRYVDNAHGALAQMQTPTPGGGMMSQYPLGYGQWLQALAHALSKPREIAIVGDPDSADTQALLSVARDGYRPFQVVALGAPNAQPPAIPLLQDRGLVNGNATAYVCRAFACQVPVTSPQALEELLGLR